MLVEKALIPVIHSALSKPMRTLLLILAAFTVAAYADEPSKRLNVLFIAVDDLRPELGCYGNTIIKSPNIDRLAKRGLQMNRAYCQQAVCSPSRASLLTGTRPDTTKVWDLSTHFRKALPDVVTLPQYFKNAGYFTQGMGKLYHHGLDDLASWSVPSTNPKAPVMRELQTEDPKATKGEKRGPAVGKVDVPDDGLHDGELAGMAVAALRELKAKAQPFFLGVGFVRPHLPFISPSKYWDLYDRAKIPLAPNPFPQKDAPGFALVRGAAELRSYAGTPNISPLPDDFARELMHGYYAAVSYMDAQVGRVLDELEKLGLSDSTIVVLWGDHGWKLGEHQAWAKHSNVENDTRVPLLISAPAMKAAGRQSDALVELVDVYPTLAELAKLPLPAHLEGRSFAPLLDDPQKPWKAAAFSQYPRGTSKTGRMGYSMRTERYRFTQWVDAKDHMKVQAVELYDHQTDPQENTNVAAAPENAALIEKLKKQWTAGWRSENSTTK
jgi:arylsulfatase A-like enzyme